MCRWQLAVALHASPQNQVQRCSIAHSPTPECSIVLLLARLRSRLNIALAQSNTIFWGQSRHRTAMSAYDETDFLEEMIASCAAERVSQSELL